MTYLYNSEQRLSLIHILDNRRSQGAKKEAMQAGSRLHRKIQKRMGADYRAEAALKHLVKEDVFSILLEGRADGIITCLLYTSIWLT